MKRDANGHRIVTDSPFPDLESHEIDAIRLAGYRGNLSNWRTPHHSITPGYLRGIPVGLLSLAATNGNLGAFYITGTEPKLYILGHLKHFTGMPTNRPPVPKQTKPLTERQRRRLAVIDAILADALRA